MMGFAGQLSLGHAIYVGLGGYTSALLFVRFGVAPWIGMLAAISVAAACGALPVSAAHSGLAEVSRALAAAAPAAAEELLSFPVDDGAVESIADRLVRWLRAPEPLRERTRAALVGTARERFSWTGVARGLLAAARGRLDDLPEPR